MVGWWIMIGEKAPEQWEALSKDERIAATLASWEAGIGGIDWLKRLTDEGKAAQIHCRGYPNRFVAKAGDVLRLLASGPPAHAGLTVLGDNYVLPGGWTGNITMHVDRLCACPADQVLTIDAWDQS